jgi:threonine/homoserine/homoserine lactone efflux protein
MPEPALYLAFILVVAALVLMPGPNVALIVATSLAHGIRYGLITVAGTSSAMVAQLALTVWGTATLLSSMAEWFEWLRWIGVAYLIYLGARAWFQPPRDDEAKAGSRSPALLYLRGFSVSLTNPKTLLFYAAFLPQFITKGEDPLTQLLVLSATFLLIAVSLDSLWCLLAARLRFYLHRKARLGNRITAVLLIAAGVGLAMARRA